VGADLRLATSRFLGGNRNLVFNAYALKSNTEGEGGDGWSKGIAAQYPNDRYDAQFIWREIPDSFDPALGFVQRSNVRMLRAGASFNPRPKKFLGIQQMFHDVFYTRFTRLDNGQVETWNLYATIAGRPFAEWHAGNYLPAARTSRGSRNGQCIIWPLPSHLEIRYDSHTQRRW
jgi:hypothetical protein